MASQEVGKAILSPRTQVRLHTAYVETQARVQFKDISDCDFDGPRRRELRIKVLPD